MSTYVTCVQGHRWEVAAAAATDPSLQIRCPVCGEPPLPPAADAPEVSLPLARFTVSPASPTVLDGRAPPPARSRELPAIPGFELLGTLGRGGMGVVYKAREVGLNRTVALKMIHAETCANPVARVRFLREAQLLASLRHPNIVQLHAVLEHEDRLCFVMECIDGVNLARRLGKGLPPARQAAQWLEAAARAIHYAHQKGVAHRDLKPGNILLDRAGTPKIIDFGLARRLEQATAGTVVDHPTRSGEILGTPNYMAPEQADGRTKEAGPSADVYALGAILYECLTGHPPFEGTTPLEMLHRIIYEEPAPPTRLQPKVPRDLETICLTCLRKEPQRRYATAEALANELRGFLAGEPIAARPAGPWERLRRWMRRRPAVAVTVGVGSVAVVGMLVGALWLSSLAVAGVAVFG